MFDVFTAVVVDWLRSRTVTENGCDERDPVMKNGWSFRDELDLSVPIRSTDMIWKLDSESISVSTK